MGRVGRMSLATKTPVLISNHDFRIMLRFARTIYALKKNSVYLKSMAANLPETARVNPENPSLLMGYDFHLTNDGPKLIEINNNAGGLFQEGSGWIPQYPNPEAHGTVQDRVARMIPEHWKHIAIMDESIMEQFMLPEMQAYAALFESHGKNVSLVSPEELLLKGDALYVGDAKVDAIYNRHTDFYLDTEAMQHIKRSFMRGQVELNPYPRSYALIGDKNRMVDWWRDGLLEACLKPDELEIIRNTVPETHLLAEYDKDKAWQSRKSWVFKPAASHGGKGVLLGKSISHKRFLDFTPESTVLQAFVAPSKIEIDGASFKFDIRLYMHGSSLIAMAGRAWNGQVTNFKGEGSGWTAIQVAD